MMPEDRKELYKLIEQWTRCEIMERHGGFGLNWPESGQDHFDHIAIADKIRELMFGTSNLVELGYRWGIIQSRGKK